MPFGTPRPQHGIAFYCMATTNAGPTPFVTLSTFNKIKLIEVSHALAVALRSPTLALPSGLCMPSVWQWGCPHGQLWTSIKFIAKQILYKGIIKAAKRLSTDGQTDGHMLPLHGALSKGLQRFVLVCLAATRTGQGQKGCGHTGVCLAAATVSSHCSKLIECDPQPTVSISAPTRSCCFLALCSKR